MGKEKVSIRSQFEIKNNFGGVTIFEVDVTIERQTLGKILRAQMKPWDLSLLVILVTWLLAIIGDAILAHFWIFGPFLT